MRFLLIYYKEESKEDREKRKIEQTLVGYIEEIKAWWMRNNVRDRKFVEDEGGNNK